MKSLLKHVHMPRGRDEQKETVVGYSVRDGTRAPFYLSADQLLAPSILVGRTRTGKTALLGHLAKAAMESGAALVVLDLDGDLAPDLAAHIPAHRVDDVCWIDLNDRNRVPGLNLLDVSHGEHPDAVVSSLLRTAPILWDKWWSRETQDSLMTAVRTLVAANQILVRQNEPQFSLLDVLRLFDLPHFCRRIVESYVSDPALREHWQQYLEMQSVSLLSDWVARVIVPIRRLVFEEQVKNIIGQSTSTFDLRERLEPGRITFVNAGGSLAPDLRRWLTALIAERINLAVFAQGPTERQVQPRRAVIAVNGNVPITDMDAPEFLHDLHECGASYILTDWPPPYLKDEESRWHDLLTEKVNLFVFRNWGPTARALEAELGEHISVAEIEDLPDHVCLIRTPAQHGDLRIDEIATLPPLVHDRWATEELLSRVKPCSRSAVYLEPDRKRFERAWFGKERAEQLLRASMPPRAANP